MKRKVVANPHSYATSLARRDEGRYALARLFFYAGIACIGQLVWRPLFSTTLSDLLFLASFVLTVFYIAMEGKLEYRLPKTFLVGVALFIFGGALSSIMSETPRVSLVILLKYLYLFVVWFWLGMVLLRTEKHILTAIFFWSFSAALNGLGAVAQVIGIEIPGAETHWGRMTGFTGHVNDLGGVEGIAFASAVMMTVYSARGKIRIVAGWLITSLMATGLVLSVSISGLIAAVVSFIVWGVLSKIRFRHLLFILVLSLSAFGAVTTQLAFKGKSIVQKIEGVVESGSKFNTVESRMITNEEAIESILANPVIGAGFLSETKSGYQVHNILLLALYETGVFGFAGMIVILLVIAKVGINLIRWPVSDQIGAIAIGIFASYLGFLTFAMGAPIYMNRYGWIAGALILSLNGVQKRLARLSHARGDSQ